MGYAGEVHGEGDRRSSRRGDADRAARDGEQCEVFRDPDIPKGQININAEDGRIVLRGQMERPDQIRTIEKAVRKVHGVREVQNLLHLPDMPAPNKRAASRFLCPPWTNTRISIWTLTGRTRWNGARCI